MLQGLGLVGLATISGCLGDGTDDSGDEDDDDGAVDGDTDDSERAVPFFNVADMSPIEESIDSGDPFAVSAVVENTGEREGRQPIEFRISDDVIDKKQLTLLPNEETGITFETDGTTTIEDGEYPFGVYSLDDQQEGTVTVGDQVPVFEVAEVAPATFELVEGDHFAITATITNTGPVEGTQLLAVRVNENEVASQELFLASGDSSSIVFADLELPAGHPFGEFTFGVHSADDHAEGSISVREAVPNFTITGMDPTDTATVMGEPIEVSATVTNTGTTPATQDIEYRISAVVMAQEELTLEVDEASTISFEAIETGHLGVGEYIHGIYSEDDEAEGKLTIDRPPLSEEQYLWTPDDYDPGDEPADVWEVGNAVSLWEIDEDTGGKFLRFRGSDGDQSFLRFAEAGESVTSELWARIKSNDPEAGEYFQYVRGVDDTTSSADAAALRVDDHASGEQFRLAAFEPGSGSVSVDNSAGDRLGISHGQAFDVRVRVTDDAFMARWWASNEDEPEDWVFDVTLAEEDDITVDGLGYSGIGHLTGDEYHLYGFGVGTDGESAPSLSPWRAPMPDPALYDGIVGLHPEDAAESFSVAPGFTVELVASEPLINTPVDIRFDAAGRMWVCEFPDYMGIHPGDGRGGSAPGNWPDGASYAENDLDTLTGWGDSVDDEPPNGAIKRLEDTNGDGQYDTATTFLDDLTMARALALVEADDGLLVAQAGRNVNEADLLLCRDTDGDGVSDEEIDVKNSWVDQTNAEHTSNGLEYMLDNWIHSSNASERFQVRGSSLAEEDDTSTYGQWGLTEDIYGRTYHTRNTNLLRGDRGPGKGENRTNLDEGSIVHPIRPNRGTNRYYVPIGETEDGWNNFHREDDRLRNATSTSGPGAYIGHQFAEAYVNDVFSPEPQSNLVTHFRLTDQPDSLGISSEHRKYAHSSENNPYDGEELDLDEVEFLASWDEIFRPVNVRTGPDGALYIVDMYNGLIQQWIYLTAYLADYYYRQTLWAIDNLEPGSGRIWKVYPEDANLSPPPDLSIAEPDDLVAHLDSANGWVRKTAQRLLVQGRERTAIMELRELAQNDNATDLGRMHALLTLSGLDEIAGESVFSVFADVDNSHVIAQAIRVGEALFDTDDEDAYVDWLEDFEDDGHERIATQAERSLATR